MRRGSPSCYGEDNVVIVGIGFGGDAGDMRTSCLTPKPRDPGGVYNVLNHQFGDVGVLAVPFSGRIFEV